MHLAMRSSEKGRGFSTGCNYDVEGASGCRAAQATGLCIVSSACQCECMHHVNALHVPAMALCLSKHLMLATILFRSFGKTRTTKCMHSRWRFQSVLALSTTLAALMSRRILLRLICRWSTLCPTRTRLRAGSARRSAPCRAA